MSGMLEQDNHGEGIAGMEITLAANNVPCTAYLLLRRRHHDFEDTLPHCTV